MIKKLIFLLLISNASLQAQTSIYHHFPDSNAVWNFHYQFAICIGGGVEENYSITLTEDTMLNGQLYHKLFTPYVQVISSGICGTQFPGYGGAIREDTIVKKVYYVPPSQTTEELLYDFNLQVGDSVRGYLESFNYSTDTVTSVDSILVGSDYRKRWCINPCYQVYIIEGIGSTYGLVHQSPDCILDGLDISLTCFSQNGNTIYPDQISSCELITSDETMPDQLNSIRVFPNPVQDECFISYPSASPNLLIHLKLYNTLGCLVFSEQTKTSPISLNISELKKGIYFLKLDSGNESFMKKLIKD